ncbi:MAG: hypothetical protein A2504_13190 [Bdellovibrionales bacterium RIFOXYD12_FULL_39_22]|nr:MAG: hypothetical protein A2385_00990 [Bdellovibrionales bacterium RIFOXYB1_FULL_39_21]OFZ43582.1 MAG: hypothetical protein A2485_12660 [Bdellovibrionales bacterium RIFOXYC12_FULL_39_17]OFZ44601.1 MAG: hypothetical protein A2404_10350 [Bdellovibrionales bacterium RIFOXYC1_FULL_39_130]OFZ76360.1 MAG: hypothetical protein A2560_06970 [Bdellovibrionales bacterium RIFOXYD1_FULL_39_84]OFZ94626.1 MAG: hypothetical protein A2504_13190 [Bdellovibrionales bacterium RIFOXYD12_FULL_39_22]HLE12918.1 hy
MNPFASMNKYLLGLKMVPINLGELFFLVEAPCNVYGFQNEQYKLILDTGLLINRASIKQIIDNKFFHIYVKEDEYAKYLASFQDAMRTLTRSLSVGDPNKNAISLMNVISLHMRHVYFDNVNDESLKLQYQGVKTLAGFLLEHSKSHPLIMTEYDKLKHNFIWAQPILSSVFLLGVLKHSQVMSKNEIESLFIASYFKDIGMSVISVDKYEAGQLNDDDKLMLLQHPKYSVQLLSGRVPLAHAYLSVIQNHHAFSLLNSYLGDEAISHTPEKVMFGFETVMVNVIDIIAAMISGRPFREATSLYDSLELVKSLIADDYPREFKLIVHYFQQFFSSKKKI